MLKHMYRIVTNDYRPFCFRDFQRFTVDGIEYKLKHGTIRNKFSRFKKEGKIELVFKSIISFYTVKGKKFAKSAMTPCHTLGIQYNYQQNQLYKMIENIPLGKNAVHDIRLKFHVNGIWLSVFNHFKNNNDSSIHINQQSKDISLTTESIEGLLLKTIIHKTDTVSVIVACSLRPIVLDIADLLRFSVALTRLEERLNRRLDIFTKVFKLESIDDNVKSFDGKVPDFRKWIVTMWHFGTDSSTQYTSDRYCVEIQDALDVLTRIYTKQFNSKDRRVRIERQEHPNISISDAINSKLANNIF